MFDPNQLAGLIALVDSAATNQDKGARFETLAMYLFEHFDGVEVTDHDIRMPSEEIDLVLWNAQREDVLRPWEAIILVECKNWSVAVGAPALDNFIGKMRRRGLKTGIFIAANGVTGGFINGDGDEPGAVGIIRAALQEGIRVIVLTMDDIRAVANIDDIRELIKRRYCGLFLHRVL
jgi:restriction endonuclease